MEVFWVIKIREEDLLLLAGILSQISQHIEQFPKQKLNCLNININDAEGEIPCLIPVGSLSKNESVNSLSCVQLFVNPWAIAHQAPLSIEFSRQEYWSGLPFPSSNKAGSRVLSTL